MPTHYRISTLFILLNFISFQILQAQKASWKKNFDVSLYGEGYYTHDASANYLNEYELLKPYYLVSYKQNNRIRPNLVFGKANYQTENVRANLALMAGDYVKYNLANETKITRHLLEANIGYKISDKYNVWIDVGVMPSHIGFETAIGIENWNLTRSLVAENSPYYESGIKVSYESKNKRLNLAALALNGWQQTRPTYRTMPSWGMQTNYKIGEFHTLNYSNFIGQVQDEIRNSWRIYHNFYWQYEKKNRGGVIVVFDRGREKDYLDKYQNWYTLVVIAKTHLSKKLVVTGRVEYFNDEKDIFFTDNYLGNDVSSFSLGLDYLVSKNIKLRAEFRAFNENKFSNYPGLYSDVGRQLINSAQINYFHWNNSICIKL